VYWPTFIFARDSARRKGGIMATATGHRLAGRRLKSRPDNSSAEIERLLAQLRQIGEFYNQQIAAQVAAKAAPKAGKRGAA
jgi:hypothetical protein